jgi:hypothetical protein
LGGGFVIQQKFKAFNRRDRQSTTTATQKLFEDSFIDQFTFKHVRLNHLLIEGLASVRGPNGT